MHCELEQFETSTERLAFHMKLEDTSKVIRLCWYFDCIFEDLRKKVLNFPECGYRRALWGFNQEQPDTRAKKAYQTFQFIAELPAEVSHCHI